MTSFLKTPRGLGSRSVGFVLALLVALGLAAPGSASADDRMGSMSAQVGALSMDLNEQNRQWLPMLQIAGTLRLAGPFEVGAYALATGPEFRLRHLGYGAGVSVGVRPQIGILYPLAEVTMGVLHLDSQSSLNESAMTLGLTVGMGVEVHSGVAVSLRMSHMWMFFASDELMPRTWTVTLGLTFALPVQS